MSSCNLKFATSLEMISAQNVVGHTSPLTKCAAHSIRDDILTVKTFVNSNFTQVTDLTGCMHFITSLCCGGKNYRVTSQC